MNSLKMSISLAAFFGLFLGGLALFFSSENQDDRDYRRANHEVRSESSTRKSKTQTISEQRELEKSLITSKTDKVEDEPSALFNDPAINQAWGLKKSDAAKAWAVSKGSRSIIVAVIDTGADINHEDLKNNMWKNPGEIGIDKYGNDKSKNEIDDDGNGFIDDVNGWNFVSNNNSLTDNHGHGTHIAGIIGAEAGNGKGIVGIAPEVSLMILKYYDPKVSGTDNLRNTVNAIKYAVKMGAHIINYSGGGLEYSQEEHDAVAEAEKKGVLFVAAAGNEKSNSDKNHYYPADYKLSNIISVTAYDPLVEVLSSSNYGVETVDIAAPGQNIRSTLPGNSYGYMTGTSQATAFVSGAAALVMAHQQTFDMVEVKKYILKTGDALSSLADKTKSSRKLNLFKALTTLDKGVGATGVVATNTSEMKNDFSSDPKSKLKDKSTTNDINRFGKNIMDAISKPKDKLGQKPGDSF